MHPIQRQSVPIDLSKHARSAKTRLFFGGSFDPPHLGHAVLGRSASDAIGRDTALVYVPAGRSPFKTTQPISDHHRIAMLELAIRDVPASELWTQEIDDARLNPGQASYWADTWAIVGRMRHEGTNRFLIGSDQALSMHQWRRYEEFWADAVVVLRDGADTPKALIEALRTLGVWDEDALAHWQESIVMAEMIDASSSSIRAALTGENTRNAAIDGLDERVHRYILDHGLYPIRADATQ